MKSILSVISIVAITACAGGMVAIAAQQRAESARAFESIALVLSSPRCANCHFEGDSPAEGDHGRIHAMVVRRGKDGRGTPAMRCTNCHQDKSLTVPHAPPGAPDWRLPPPGTPMAWKGLSAGDQCRMLKDPSRNGHKTPEQVLEHMSRDPLVLAGWDSGPGRLPPPMSHSAFVEVVRIWVEGGAACPE